MNLYKINECEGRDLYCEECGKLMSTKDYLENNGICDDCVEPRIFVTSDTHFGHLRSFLYEPRGFSSIEEHDATIIKNWNATVAPTDEVYHLGDVMLGDNEYGLKCLKQLNGKIHIICGNHCTDTRRELYKQCDNVVEIVDAKRLKYGKYRFFLTHYPCLCANYDDGRPLKQHCINICGHTHTLNKWIDWNKGIIYHCELDCQNNKPVSIEQIISELKVKMLENKDK